MIQIVQCLLDQEREERKVKRKDRLVSKEKGKLQKWPQGRASEKYVSKVQISNVNEITKGELRGALRNAVEYRIECSGEVRCLYD